MKEKDLITDDELTHVKDKYFDEKPKHTASKSISAEKSMTKAFIIGLVVITVFFILFLLTALNNDPTKATKTNQQNNQIVSENQTLAVQTITEQGQIKGTNVNMREYPSVSAQVIFRFPGLEYVTIHEVTSPEQGKYPWFKVSYNNMTGWVYGQYIKR